MIDLENFFSFGFSSYGLAIEGYFADIYLPYRTLMLTALIFLSLKAWKWWRNK